LQCGSFLTLYSEESKAQCLVLSTLDGHEGESVYVEFGVKHSKRDFLFLMGTVGIIAGGTTIWFERQRGVAEKLINSNRSTPAETLRLIQERQERPDDLVVQAERDRIYRAYFDERTHTMPTVGYPRPYTSNSYTEIPTHVEVVPSDSGELLLIAPSRGKKDIRVRLTVERARELIDDLTRELDVLEKNHDQTRDIGQRTHRE
jgi:hypothetical protein